MSSLPTARKMATTGEGAATDAAEARVGDSRGNRRHERDQDTLQGVWRLTTAARRFRVLDGLSFIMGEVSKYDEDGAASQAEGRLLVARVRKLSDRPAWSS
jgi:hypothetical protein